jgi:hypothetical protein
MYGHSSETDHHLDQPTHAIPPAYTPPEVLEVGSAARLINSGSGKHTDSYTGYYWNGEG